MTDTGFFQIFSKENVFNYVQTVQKMQFTITLYTYIIACNNIIKCFQNNLLFFQRPLLVSGKSLVNFRIFE